MALAWDSHVHHARIRSWFAEHGASGWATCPVTEAGFVRVSANHRVLPAAVSVADARAVLAALRGAGAHRLLVNDVSVVDPEFPAVGSHRHITDGLLLAVAVRHGTRLVTFDAGIARFAPAGAVELLRS